MYVMRNILSINILLAITYYYYYYYYYYYTSSYLDITFVKGEMAYAIGLGKAAILTFMHSLSHRLKFYYIVQILFKTHIVH